MSRDPLSYMSYTQYLATPRGLKMRERALERAGYRCQICNSSGVLNLHHRSYENLGSEQESDVLMLCLSCCEVAREQQRQNMGVSGVEMSASRVPKKEPTLLERGVAAYLQGAITQPKLATALDISLWQARQLMPQIESALKERNEEE